MASENFFGICGEPTEYLDEFRRYVIPRHTTKVCDEKNFSKKATIKSPKFSTSYDTLQKLDYANRPPFDALWLDQPKTVGLNYRVPFCVPTSRKEEPRVSSRKKSFALANPAIDVDQAEDPELRKIVLDYTYKTWKSQNAEEVWRDLIKLQSSIPICNDSINSATSEFKHLPSLPAGFKGAAKKWDSLQDRTVVDDQKPPRRAAGASKKLSEPVQNRELMNDKTSRRPDEKTTHGCPRKSLARRIDVEKKNVSTNHPDPTDSQTSVVETSEG